MSVILEALQKARRDNIATDGSDPYSAIHAPMPLHQKRRRGSILLILLSLMLTLVVCVTVGYLYVSTRLQEGQHFWDVVFQRQPAAKAAVAGAAQSDLPVPTMLDGSARPGEALAELPAPVPITELSPEADTTLPPAPAAGANQAAAPSKVMISMEGETDAPVRRQAVQGFTLGSILYDENDAIAVVNGLTVRAGRDYGDFRVLKITPRQVIVQRSGEKAVTLTAR